MMQDQAHGSRSFLEVLYGEMLGPDGLSALTRAELLRVAESIEHPESLRFWVSRNIPYNLRNRMIEAAGRLGKPKPLHAAALLRDLLTEDLLSRCLTAKALAAFGELCPLQTVELLEEMAEDEYAAVREATAEALGVVATKSPEVFDRMVEHWVPHCRWEVREVAARALNPRQPWRERSPSLVFGRLAEDPVASVRSCTASSIGPFLNYGADDLSPVLERMASDLRWQVRQRVAESMAQSCGCLLGKSMKILDRMVKDLIPAVGRTAAESIRVIGARDPDNLLRVMQRAARDSEWLTPDILKIVLSSVEDVASRNPLFACRVLARLARDEDPEISAMARDLIDKYAGSDGMLAAQ